MKNLRSLLGKASLLTASLALAGCPCPVCEQLTCGDGTVEVQVGEVRSCEVIPLSCGSGQQEQATGGQRECQPTTPGDILECGTDTYQQEQATGGQRECVPGASSCTASQIEILNDDGTTGCMDLPLACGEGTHEQTTGGQRECVLDDTGLGCGEGTHEQTTGGQRECLPGP